MNPRTIGLTQKEYLKAASSSVNCCLDHTVVTRQFSQFLPLFLDRDMGGIFGGYPAI